MFTAGMLRSASDRPLVSFIIASHNYQQFIGTTLRSILEQTVQDFEIIVVDDASTDASVDVVRSFRDPRIHLHVNDRNIGIAPTYNKGVGLANGQYITWIDADDWIEPRKVEEQLGFFGRHRDLDLVGSYSKFFDKDGKRHPLSDTLERFFNQPYDFNAIETWIGDHKMLSCSVLIERLVFDRIGRRDETMLTASDYEFWARAHARGCRFGMVEAPLLCYRVHDDNASMQNPEPVLLEMSYVLQNVVLPAIETTSAQHLIPNVFGWVVSRIQAGWLGEEQGCQLLAVLAGPRKYTDCRIFKTAVLRDDPAARAVGKALFATYRDIAHKLTG